MQTSDLFESNANCLPERPPTVSPAAIPAHRVGAQPNMRKMRRLINQLNDLCDNSAATWLPKRSPSRPLNVPFRSINNYRPIINGLVGQLRFLSLAAAAALGTLLTCGAGLVGVQVFFRHCRRRVARRPRGRPSERFSTAVNACLC